MEICDVALSNTHRCRIDTFTFTGGRSVRQTSVIACAKNRFDRFQNLKSCASGRPQVLRRRLEPRVHHRTWIHLRSQEIRIMGRQLPAGSRGQQGRAIKEVGKPTRV